MVPLLTITQAAERLNLSRSGVYGLLSSGALRSVVLGKRARRIREDDVERLIESRTVDGLGRSS